MPLTFTERLALFFLTAAKHYRRTDPPFSQELRKQAYRLLGLST